MSKIDDLIGKSVKKPINTTIDNSLTEQLFKNADKALGLQPEPEPIKKGSVVKNLTFSFGLDEVNEINTQVERFLLKGKSVSKSELVRIGLKLIELTPENKLPELTTLIAKHVRGRQS